MNFILSFVAVYLFRSIFISAISVLYGIGSYNLKLSKPYSKKISFSEYSSLMALILSRMFNIQKHLPNTNHGKLANSLPKLYLTSIPNTQSPDIYLTNSTSDI